MILILLILLNLTLQAELAFVQVPVADLICDQIKKLESNLTPPDFYAQIPLSPMRPGKDIMSCPRQHQAILHEIVDILEQRDEQALVRIFNAYYLDLKTGQKSHSFWTLKTNLLSLKKIPSHREKLPLPINYHYPKRYEKDVITLLDSWQCPQTNLTYSAGTRFKIDPQDQAAFLYDQAQQKFIKVQIPTHLILKNSPKTSTELRKLFVNLVQKWANNLQQKFIPYTWGGCSIIQRIPTQNFKAIQAGNLAYYAVPPFIPQVQTGVDCSGLVLRAAQTAGIPFFYKNTSTLKQALSPVTQAEQLLPGDLIWLSGHVIIIAEPQTGWCVEARDYGHGYGQVQQIHVSKLFKNIANFTQLKAAYHADQPIERIDRFGNSKGKYQIKLLKLI